MLKQSKVNYEFVSKSDADNAKDALLEKMYHVRTNRKGTLGGPQVETTLLNMYWSSDYVGMRARIQSLTGAGGATRNACIRCLDTIISYEAGRKKAVYNPCKKDETTSAHTPQVQKVVETPKKEYLPRTQENWMSCKFGVNTIKKTGYGYTWDVKPMEELPEALQNFRYNEKFTIREFHQYVGEHYNTYADAGKVRIAFEKLKARIDVYNTEVRESAVDLQESVKRSDSLLNWIIQEQQKTLGKQNLELRAACIKAGVKPKVIEALLDWPEKYAALRAKTLLKAVDFELELPPVEAPALEQWRVPELQGYTKYNPDDLMAPAKYTDEEREAAAKTDRVIRWTQDITEILKPMREDILILMTLYLAQVDAGGVSFLRRDEFGDVIERDMDAAPTTEEEFLLWKQKREAERVVKFCGSEINNYYKK